MDQRDEQGNRPPQQPSRPQPYQQGYYVDNQQDDEDPFPLFDYLQLLWFRRHLVIAISVFVAVLGFIYVNQLVPMYTANATMMIGGSKTQVVDIQEVLDRQFYGNEAVAEVEVLRSRGLANSVIDKLKLLNYEEFNPSLRVDEPGFLDFLKYLNPKTWIPESWKTAVSEAISGKVEAQVPLNEEEMAHSKRVAATDLFLSKLSIEAQQRSNVLNVEFDSKSPVLAARIANALPEVYMREEMQAKFDATEKATSWLTEQLEGLKTQVSESERAVEIYREAHGLTKGASISIQDEQLSEVNSQLIVARADRAQAQARLDQLMRLVETEGQGIEMAGDVLSSPGVQQLQAQEAEVMRQASELAVEFGPKHPRRLQVEAELEDIRRRIGTEISKIKLALDNELELARTREQSLQNSLRGAQLETSEQNKESVQLRALEREAAANRVLYENFLNRFKETSSTQGLQTSDARVISRAEVPVYPSYPNKKRMFMLIALLGFMAACGLVFALFFLNPGMHSPEQVEKELGVHTIGVVPILKTKKTPFEYLMTKPHSGYMEAINSLNVSLKLSDPDMQIKAIQVTSSVPGEGKSTLVFSLAAVMANEGKKVLIIDGDLRRSSLPASLDISADGPGLTDFVLATNDKPDEFIFKHEESGIHFIRTGEAKYANATDIFTSKRMHTIIDILKETYDYILIDTPPVMAVADARVIGQIADKTIFVVRWDKTPKKVAQASIELLRQGGTNVAGIVLQQVDLNRYGKLGYGESGYYYHYGKYNSYYQ